MPSSSPSRLAAPLLLALLGAAPLLVGGCAHYGWAEPSADRREASPAAAVAVLTVAIDADRGVDVALLTRTLVTALRERGVDARWQPAPPGEAAIDCRVGLDDGLGFGDHVRVEAIALCRWSDQVIERRATTAATLQPAALSASLRPVHQATAARALRQAAAPLAELLVAATSSVQTSPDPAAPPLEPR